MNSNGDSSVALSPNVVKWAASVLVKRMPDDDILQKFGDKECALKRLAGKVNGPGLRTLTKKEVRWIWDVLKLQPFVYNNTLGYRTHISSSALKDDLVDHVQRFLSLPNAADLVPLDVSSATQPTSPAAPQPAPASVAANRYHTQPQQQFSPVYGQAYRQPNGFGQIPNSANNNRSFGATLRAAYMSYASTGMANPNHNAASGFTGDGMAPLSTNGAQFYCEKQVATTASANHKSVPKTPTASDAFNTGRTSSSLKRPPPSSANRTMTSSKSQKSNGQAAIHEMQDPWAALAHDRQAYNGSHGETSGDPVPASAMQAASHSAPSAAAPAAAIATPDNDPSRSNEPQTPEDRQLYDQLCVFGFPVGECMNHIREYRQKNPGAVPDAESILNFVLMQDHNKNNPTAVKSEAELAREMDEARALSEETKEAEDRRLGIARKEENEKCLLRATLTEWLHSKDADNKSMFPDSLLLRHEPVKSLLEDVASNEDHLETKKSLIKLLKLEKNALKWYHVQNIKSYFTNKLGRLFLSTSINSLKTVIISTTDEVDKGMSLLSKQDDNGIPIIFKEAEGEEKENNSSGESNSDNPSSEDEIVMLSSGSDKSTDQDQDLRKPAPVEKKQVEVIELL